jgi:hypothetical protein
MIVHVFLDSSQGLYTNLDLVSGKVILKVPTNTSVSSVTVKLEGESRTRLINPNTRDRNDRQRIHLEVHKVHLTDTYKQRLRKKS